MTVDPNGAGSVDGSDLLGFSQSSQDFLTGDGGAFPAGASTGVAAAGAGSVNLTLSCASLATVMIDVQGVPLGARCAAGWWGWRAAVCRPLTYLRKPGSGLTSRVKVFSEIVEKPDGDGLLAYRSIREGQITTSPTM